MVEPRSATSYGFYSNERLQELAKPKPTKDVWNFHRKLIWGNQEPIWPLSSRTLLRQPSPRILTLARPRETVDKQKRSLFVFSCGQMSEIWKRSSTVYSAMPTKRLLKLAEPRPISATYLKLRNAEEGKKEMQRKGRKKETKPNVQIPLTALQAVPSPRLLELARPKTIPSDSAMDRSPEWPVSVAAKQAVASPRLTELAQPPNRAPTNLVQFNPDAFIVKESAKKAFCTERVKNLAQPITR
ncbi:testicular haploid expressed gene protein-like isoform X5 [Crotalus tigris]|uniref:testicular haploid expressed gene protein-like isoform X5 n=1 Tax=Crotalus tigris TaxID=88082 RepID=UPI00192F1787|nr:testicular haploid expressed gene protein-like isoform X5 [Crotalus tigris]